MKGYSHALSGSAAWLAATSGSGIALGSSGLSPRIALVGSVVCAGAALLPDVDHPEGTIAWSLPSITAGGSTIVPSPTKALCDGVERISGGHRHATHSLVGSAIFVVVAYLLSLIQAPVHGRTVAVGAGICALLMISFASKALGLHRAMSEAGRGLGGSRRRGRGKRSTFGGLISSVVSATLNSWLGPWIVAGAAAGYVTWYLGWAWSWLALAVATGAVVHNLGDSLTKGGVPWLWPWHPSPPKRLSEGSLGRIVNMVWHDNGYFCVPVLGHTESTRESVLSAVLGLYSFYLVLYEMFRMAGNTYMLY